MTYCWSQTYSFQQTTQECRFVSKHPSKETIEYWYIYRRKVFIFTLDNLYEEQDRIGGPGCVVEIDETKIRKRKYDLGYNHLTVNHSYNFLTRKHTRTLKM